MQRKKNVPAFIRNTYQMLQREELKDIVSWQQKQNGFVIKKLDAFTNDVLPQYFKHKKYPSFVRQLNMYGFHKQRSKDNLHSYGHQFFKKGVMENKDRMLFMQALKRKPEKKKKVTSLVKNETQDLQKQERSISEDQSSQKQSVSIQLQDQKEYVNSSQANIRSESRYGRKQSLREDCKVFKTESLKFFPADQDENQQQSSIPQQNKLEAIVIQQNIILQRVHSTIREQLLKCKEMMKNKAMGLGSILNNGEPIECALKLANLLNQQTLALQKLVEISSQLHDTSE